MSSTRHIVVIGGVAGGMSAAARLRRVDEHCRITVVERSGHVSFANCGLPYYIGGVIEERDALLLQSPRSLAARFGIEVLVHTEVTAIDTVARTVTLTGCGDDPQPGPPRVLDYDALVLSPGARPILPPIPGIGRALTLRDIEDTDAMAAAAATARTAVVIGGGFIGVEVAENLRRRGVDVALVEATGQILAPLDPEMAGPVHERMRAEGVDLHLNRSAAEITDIEVVLDDGTSWFYKFKVNIFRKSTYIVVTLYYFSIIRFTFKYIWINCSLHKEVYFT